MPEPDIIPISASVASVGNNLRYVGNWAYGYSGVVGVTGSVTQMFEATSGSGLIVAKMQINSITNTDNNLIYLIYLNDLIVQGYSVNQGTDRINTQPDNPLPLIIPPFTNIKVTGENKSAGTSRDHAVTIVGRVYGAV